MTEPQEQHFDLDRLARDWRTAPPSGPLPRAVSEQLDRQVRRGTRRLVGTTFLELAITVAVFVLLAQLVPPGKGSISVFWGLAVLHTAAVWGFTLWNRRGLWRPLGQDTTSFLHLVRKRAARRLAAAKFALALILVEVALAVGLLLVAPTRQALLALLFLGAAAGIAFRARGAARRALDHLDRLDDEASGRLQT